MSKKKNPQTNSGAQVSIVKPPIQCSLCANVAWRGPGCPSCSLYQQHHYAEGIGDTKKVEFFCVAEYPDLAGPSGDIEKHTPWMFSAEKMIKDAFAAAMKKHPSYANLSRRYTFAVRCDTSNYPVTKPSEKPSKTNRACCRPLFTEELTSMAAKNRPIMVFALGPGVLQSLELTVRKYADVQGQFVETKLEDRRVLIFPSLSKKQLLSRSGFSDILSVHIDQFLEAVYGLRNGIPVQTSVPMDELKKNYIFPKTLAEVRKLVETIVPYANKGRDPHKHFIALDTETNTVNPHREKLKILSLVVAWDIGKAAAIPIEHPESPWTLPEVYPYISQLLMCEKPKVFHNAKFDLKVLNRKGWQVKNFAWDTMTAEHLLAEDKRGFYGLKSLARTYFPRYAGYAEELKASREAEEEPEDGETEPVEKKEEEETEKKEEETKLTGIAKKLAEDNGFIGVPLDILNPYSAIDADVTRQLCQLQLKRMVNETIQLNKVRGEYAVKPRPDCQAIAQKGSEEKNPLNHLFQSVVLPVTKTLAAMELRGMRVDREYAHKLDIDMTRTILLLRSELHLMITPGGFTETAFNPNSTVDIQKVLFGQGYLHPETNKVIAYTHLQNDPVVPRTATGKISLNQAFLKMLAETYKCPFSAALLKYRALVKLQSTFIRNAQILSEEDGRLHTDFGIASTSTGRLASTPNVQNTPKKVGAHNIKKLFIPTDPATQVIVNADAKAAEVRIYAAYSRDKNLIDALNQGLDPHSYFASMVYKPEVVLAGVPQSAHSATLAVVGLDTTHPWSYEDFQNREALSVTDKLYGKQLDKLRTNIKRVVFGILYGAGKKKISATAGIPVAQAEIIIEALFTMFPTLKEYVYNTHLQIEHVNAVETFFGRRRRFAYRGMANQLQARAKRQGVNFKIQSTSSDIVLGVMCDMSRALEELDSHMLITVHDSLVWESPIKYIDQLPALMEEYGVKRVAQRCPWLPVKFPWDLMVGPSYGELQTIEQYHKKQAIQDTEDDFVDIDIKNDFANSKI